MKIVGFSNHILSLPFWSLPLAPRSMTFRREQEIAAGSPACEVCWGVGAQVAAGRRGVGSSWRLLLIFGSVLVTSSLGNSLGILLVLVNSPVEDIVILEG